MISSTLVDTFTTKVIETQFKTHIPTLSKTKIIYFNQFLKTIKTYNLININDTPIYLSRIINLPENGGQIDKKEFILLKQHLDLKLDTIKKINFENPDLNYLDFITYYKFIVEQVELKLKFEDPLFLSIDNYIIDNIAATLEKNNSSLDILEIISNTNLLPIYKNIKKKRNV